MRRDEFCEECGKTIYASEIQRICECGCGQFLHQHCWRTVKARGWTPKPVNNG